MSFYITVKLQSKTYKHTLIYNVFHFFTSSCEQPMKEKDS